MKVKIIKIVSIVLVLCTLLTAFVIPASAYINVHEVDFEDLDLSNLIVVFPIDRFGIRKYNSSSGKMELTGYDHMEFKHYVVDSSAAHTYIETKPVDTYLNLITWQSREYDNWDYKEGDTITFSISILAPPCDEVAFFIYYTDGTRDIVPMMRSSEKVWSNEMLLRDYCTGTKGYGGLQFCHRYIVNHQFISDGRDIKLVQIQQKFSTANKIKSSWIFYEDCKFSWVKSNSSVGIFSVFSKIGNWVSELYLSIREFFLSFGSKIYSAVQPLFTSIESVFIRVGESISTAYTNVTNGLKTTFSNVGDTLKTSFNTVGTSLKTTFTNVGESISSAYTTVTNGLKTTFSNVGETLKTAFNTVGTTLKNTFTTVGEGISTAYTNVTNGLKTTFSNVGESLKTSFSAVGDLIVQPIENLGQNLYNWFAETFLGKVLRISSKAKEFINAAGNDIQYAALDDIEGESIEEKSPDDWDMSPRPSFETNVDYYLSLYPDITKGD